MYNHQTIDVLIPARGGSKGIPKKNLVDIAGRPLISYSITAALRSKFTDNVFVSSDDPEILDAARKYGASPILRDPCLATDTIPTEPTLIQFCEISSADYIILCQATSPLIDSSDIDTGIQLLDTYDSVISACALTQFTWSAAGPDYDINNRMRRQDLPPRYLETGSFFISPRSAILSSQNRISGRVGMAVIPKYRSIDIDDYDDLELVRSIVSSGTPK